MDFRSFSSLGLLQTTLLYTLLDLFSGLFKCGGVFFVFWFVFFLAGGPGGWGLRIYFTFGISEVPSVVKSKLVCTKKGRREWKKSVFLRVWSKMTHSKIIWTVC